LVCFDTFRALVEPGLNPETIYNFVNAEEKRIKKVAPRGKSPGSATTAAIRAGR